MVTCKIQHWNILQHFCKCFILHVTVHGVTTRNPSRWHCGLTADRVRKIQRMAAAAKDGRIEVGGWSRTEIGRESWESVAGNDGTWATWGTPAPTHGSLLSCLNGRCTVRRVSLRTLSTPMTNSSSKPVLRGCVILLPVSSAICPARLLSVYTVRSLYFHYLLAEQLRHPLILKIPKEYTPLTNQ